MSESNGTNGTNGNGTLTKPHLPSIEELRRAYEQGIPQTLLSGLEVVMRPVQPDKLLMAGKMPDILTPVMMAMLFPKEATDTTEFPDEVGDPIKHFLEKERAKAADAMEFVRAVNVVCEAALVDSSVVPYLSLADRMWIFKLAFLPTEVLSTFRLQSLADVESVDEGDQVQQAAV